MNCPYCSKRVFGMTGFQEADAFRKHLRRCRNNPANLEVKSGTKTMRLLSNPTIQDALRIRAESGQ